MFKIDIIGSCVCRDVFNSKFNSDYSSYFELVTYVPRTTVVGLVSPSIKYDMSEISNKLTPWKYECCYKAFEKNALTTLCLNQSNVLLIDFYTDAYQGIVVLDNGDILPNTGVKKQYKNRIVKKFNYRKNPKEYFELWKKCADYFFEFCKNSLPNTQIVINGIKGSNKYLEDSTEKIHLENVDIERLNSFWKKMDDYVNQTYGIPIIGFEKQYYLSDEYIFGGLAKEVVHFTKDYYSDFLHKFLVFCEKNKVFSDEIDVSSINFCKNNDFSLGMKYWDYSNAMFDIVEFNQRKWICLKEALSDNRYSWIWSNPIEINSNGDNFILEFDYYVKDSIPQKNSSIFAIRTFDKAIQMKYNESNDALLVVINSYDVANKVLHMTYSFKPNGKYIRIAPHFDSFNTSIFISNVFLHKGEGSCEYVSWEDLSIEV